MPARRAPDPAFSHTRFTKWRRSTAAVGQEEFARRLRYSQAQISRIEQGRRPPTARFLEAVQRVFGVDPAQFFVKEPD